MVNYSEDSKRFQALLIDQHSLRKLCLGIRKEEKNLDIYKYSYKEYLKIKSKNLKISLKIQKSGTNSNFSCKIKWEIIFRLYRKQRNLLKKLQGYGYRTFVLYHSLWNQVFTSGEWSWFRRLLLLPQINWLYLQGQGNNY